MVESHSGTTTVSTVGVTKNLFGADSNPRQFASYAVTLRLLAHSTDADHRIEFPGTDRPHAVMIAKHSRLRVRIAGVRPLVDQCSHVPSWWEASSLLNGDLHGAKPFPRLRVVTNV